MNFSEIKPYVRYIQRFKITKPWAERYLIPRDNRLFFCLCGSGDITVGDRDCEMTRGSALLIPSGTPYILHIPESELTYISVNFDYTLAHCDLTVPASPVSPEEFSANDIIEHSAFSDEPMLNTYVYAKHIPSLEAYLSSMLSSYNKKLLYYENELS